MRWWKWCRRKGERRRGGRRGYRCSGRGVGWGGQQPHRQRLRQGIESKKDMTIAKERYLPLAHCAAPGMRVRGKRKRCQRTTAPHTSSCPGSSIRPFLLALSTAQILLVFSTDSKASFDKLEALYREAVEVVGKQVPAVLLGNKVREKEKDREENKVCRSGVCVCGAFGCSRFFSLAVT